MLKPESLAAARKFWKMSDAIDAMHPTTLDEIIAKESAICDLQAYVSSLPKEIMDEIAGLRRSEVIGRTWQEIEAEINLLIECVDVLIEALSSRIEPGAV